MEEWVRFGWAGWQDREEPEPRVFVISILIIVNKRGKVVCDICTFKESTYSESPPPLRNPRSSTIHSFYASGEYQPHPLSVF